MQRLLRNGSAGIVAGLLILGLAGSPSAGAVTVKLRQTVNAQTTLATLKQTVVFPTGSFVGGVNFVTGKMTGTLKLPDATTTVNLAGIGLANATVEVVPTQEVVGHFNFKNYHVRATSVFNIDVVSVTPVLLGTPNLVGNSCTTSTPVSLVFNGRVSPFEGGTVYGSYAIPKLRNCGAITVALNQLMSGPGNSFSANMMPTL